MTISECFYEFLQSKLELNAEENFFMENAVQSKVKSEFAILEYIGEQTQFEYSTREELHYRFNYFCKSKSKGIELINTYRKKLLSLGRFSLNDNYIIQDLELLENRVDLIKYNSQSYYKIAFEIIVNL